MDISHQPWSQISPTKPSQASCDLVRWAINGSGLSLTVSLAAKLVPVWSNLDNASVPESPSAILLVIPQHKCVSVSGL